LAPVFIFLFSLALVLILAPFTFTIFPCGIMPLITMLLPTMSASLDTISLRTTTLSTTSPSTNALLSPLTVPSTHLPANPTFSRLRLLAKNILPLWTITRIETRACFRVLADFDAGAALVVAGLPVGDVAGTHFLMGCWNLCCGKWLRRLVLVVVVGRGGAWAFMGD
jgi:hypothetical protein